MFYRDANAITIAIAIHVLPLFSYIQTPLVLVHVFAIFHPLLVLVLVPHIPQLIGQVP
jgi:hypothetical protein